MPRSHHPFPSARLAVGFALLGLALLPGQAAAAIDRTVVDDTRALLEHSVSSLSERSDSSDWRYFSDGLWINGDNTCWRCNVGPGTAAAVLARDGSHDHARSLAIQTMDRAIAERQRADGSFPDVSPGTSSPGVNTMFFAHQLGTAYWYLKDSLDPERAERWRSSLARAADFLIDRGEVTWYANGNLNLGYTEVLLLAWEATRLERFRTAYDRSFEFTLNPPQDRWPGYGLKLTKAPSEPDGSDGKGYLAEGTWTSGPGYDPDYTQLQADIASRIWLESRDPRARRLLNLLVNQLRDRVDSDWQLDTSGGSRIPNQGRKVGFITPAIAVLAWTAGRDDLAPLVRPHFDFVDATFRSSVTNGSWYYRLGTEPPVLLQAAYAGTSPPPSTEPVAEEPRLAPPSQPLSIARRSW